MVVPRKDERHGGGVAWAHATTAVIAVGAFGLALGACGSVTSRAVRADAPIPGPTTGQPPTAAAGATTAPTSSSTSTTATTTTTPPIGPAIGGPAHG